MRLGPWPRRAPQGVLRQWWNGQMGLGHGIDSHSDSAHTSFAIVLHRHQKALLFRPLLALYGCVFWRGITADAEKNPEGHGPHRRKANWRVWFFCLAMPARGGPLSEGEVQGTTV